MGAGRKLTTYTIDTSKDDPYDNWSKMQRNLGDSLGGCIFGCTDDTYEECVNGLIFGLPRNHWLYVQHVQEGMPVFLFSYTNRKLHGIFKAVSEGGTYNPQGWCEGSSSRTRFPSQVRVEVYQQCPPLPEKDYKPILKDCYVWDGQRSVLVFELTKKECQALCHAFAHAAGRPVPIGRPQPKAVMDKDGFTQVTTKKSFVPAAGPSGSAWGAKPKAGGLGAIAEGSADIIVTGDPFGGLEPIPDDTPRVFHPLPPALPFSPEVEALQFVELHDAVFELSPPVASYLWKVLEGVGRLIDHATQERVQLAHQLSLRQANEARLIQEADALRKDLAFVGNQINVVVLDTSDPIKELLESIKPAASQSLYLIGGDYELSTNNNTRMDVVEIFSAESSSMVTAPLDDSARRVNGAGAGLGRSIYICGGAIEGRKWLNSCLRFDVDTAEYVPIAPMKYNRGGFDAVTLKEHVYVLGGTGLGNAFYNHGEYYDPVVNVWHDLPTLSKRRFNCTVEKLEGSLFCVGGFDGAAYLTSVERYDPREGKWAEAPAISTKRAAHVCEVLNGQIYIMGGYGSASDAASSFLSTTEVYDPRANAWREGPDMGLPRAYGNSGVVDGFLYVMCGMNAVPSSQGSMTTHYNHSMQYLDVVTDTWNEVAWPTTIYPTGRAYGVAAVL